MLGRGHCEAVQVEVEDFSSELKAEAEVESSSCDLSATTSMSVSSTPGASSSSSEVSVLTPLPRTPRQVTSSSGFPFQFSNGAIISANSSIPESLVTGSYPTEENGSGLGSSWDSD